MAKVYLVVSGDCESHHVEMACASLREASIAAERLVAWENENYTGSYSLLKYGTLEWRTYDFARGKWERYSDYVRIETIAISVVQ